MVPLLLIWVLGAKLVILDYTNLFYLTFVITIVKSIVTTKLRANELLSEWK